MERELESTCLAYTRELMLVIISNPRDENVDCCCRTRKEDYLER